MPTSDDSDLTHLLRQAETWIARLVQTTQDAVVTIDDQRRIVLFNAAAERMFGWRWDEVRGRNVDMLMPDPYASEHDRYIARYEQTGEPHAIGRIRTVTAKRKGGEHFPIELSVTEVGHEGATRYGAFIRDISEKVRLEEELLERERLAAIGTTAAKFAHEVSNPLNGMYTQAQLMQRRLARLEAPDERIVRGVEMLLRDIERLNGLLDEFRSMSRRQEFRFAPTSLASLCVEVRDAEAATYAERGVRLDVQVPDDLPLVRADGPRLKQVLLNLCKNAAEAMPEGGGTIRVRAEVDGDGVCLEVADTGRGIPDGVDVFAPFATTKPAGTGLGLPIVRQIVTGHGGTIDYTTEPGQGTTFRIHLPCAVPTV